MHHRGRLAPLLLTTRLEQSCEKMSASGLNLLQQALSLATASNFMSAPGLKAMELLKLWPSP